MSTFKTISSNTLYQVAGKVVSIALGLAITALLTRNLGQAGYGQYTLITTVILFFVSLTDWGTGFIATRIAAKKEFPEGQIYGNLVILRLASSFIGAAAMLILQSLHIINLPFPLVFTGSIVLFAMALRTTMQVIFQVHLQLQYNAIVEVAGSIIFFALTWWGLTQTIINPQLAVTYLLASSMAAALLALHFGRQLSPITYLLSSKILKLILKESAPMGALLVVFSVYNRLDAFLLQYFQDDTAVGIYGLAYKVHDNLVLGAAFFMNAMYPLIARSQPQRNSPPYQGGARGGHLNLSTNNLTKKRKNEKTKIQNLFSTSFHLLLISGLIISILFFIFARPVILALSDPSYLPAVILLRILMVATAIAYLNHLTGYTLAALGLQRVSLLIALIALLANLVLNYIFIPQFSYFASAYITIVTELMILIATLTYLIKKQHLTPQISSLPSTLQNLLSNRKQLF